MKRYLAYLILNVVSVLLIVLVAIMIILDKSDWGWVLACAVGCHIWPSEVKIDFE